MMMMMKMMMMMMMIFSSETHYQTPKNHVFSHNVRDNVLQPHKTEVKTY